MVFVTLRFLIRKGLSGLLCGLNETSYGETALSAGRAVSVQPVSLLAAFILTALPPMPACLTNVP